MSTKIKFEIKNRFTGKILFSYEKENNSISETILEAIKSRADLRDADLSRADLSRADLRDADLSRADLSRADLSRADLSDANLSDANLRDADLSRADLSRADLSDADLRDADLSRADLRDADLSRADLSDANLRDADLSDADLSDAKEDLFSILSLVPNEVETLKEKIISGQIEGSVYEGDCCCLVGTIANAKKCYYLEIDGIKPNGSRPAERWFLAIHKDDNPKNSKVAAITLEWIDEFLSKLNS